MPIVTLAALLISANVHGVSLCCMVSPAGAMKFAVRHANNHPATGGPAWWRKLFYGMGVACMVPHARDVMPA